MRKPKQSSGKTIFEQVPIELARTIARRETGATAAGLVSCSVCGNPVELEQCKINENGKAVHDICYLTTIQTRQSTGVSAP